MTKPRKSSLREALAKRLVREETFSIRIADDSAATKKLADAGRQKLLSGIGKDDDAELNAKLQKAVDEAQAEVDACWHPIVLRALPRDEFEALIAAHPPKEGADKEAVWDRESLLPAVVAACAVDSDLNEKEWAEELKAWSFGDSNTLFRTAMDANRLAINDGLGKG